MQIHNAAVTGSFTYNGIDISDITGSEQSVVSLNEFSASILNYTSSNNQSVATLQGATASLQNATSSLHNATSSLQNATSSLFAATASLSGATSSLFAYTASNSANVASLFATSASLNAAVTQIYNATASLYSATASIYNATASIYGATSSLFNYSASSNLRIGSLEQYTASLNTRSASFACVTATNNFACTQYFSNTSNAVSFTSTGSLYSDGGVRITRDMYVSGTAFFNNVTVFGTQSINYISSSQLNIASNIISVNTATPTVRFGGLAVYDSGSLGTGLTGSILWDSEDNQWIYSNPSGSTYDSALFLVGPRNTGVLGNEQGISCNFLSKGNGMHHMTSSGIFEDGSRTCFYGSGFITNTGVSCFTTSCAASIIGGSISGTTISGTTGTFSSNVVATGSLIVAPSSNVELQVQSTGVTLGNIVTDTHNVTGSLRITGSFNSIGVGCFSAAVCAPTFVGTTNVNTGTSCIVDSHMININGDQASVNVGLTLRNTNVSFPKVYGLTNVNNNLNLYDYTANSQRLRIDTNGIACFACQVCTPGMDIMPSGIGVNTLGGIMRVVTTGTSAGIAVGQSNANRYTHIASNDIQVFNDDFFLSTRCAFPLSIGTCYTARLTFAATGIACFSCQVCAPAFVGGTVSGTTGVFSSTGRFTGTLFSDCRLQVGVNGADQSYASVFIGGALTCGTNQYAILLDPQLSGTNNYGVFANARIKASTAATNAYAVYALNNERLSGATITNNYGVYIENQTNGSSVNYALYSAGGPSYFAGCVGIGTTTPTFLLDLQRSSAGADVAIRVQNTAASGINDAAALHLGWSSTLAGYSSIITDRGGRAGTSAAQGSLYFNANQDTVERIRMTIRGDSGNVGIGCTSPATALHVAGGATTEGQIITANSNVFYSSGVNFYTGNTNRGFVGWRYGCSTAPFTLPGIHLFNTDNSNIVFGTTNNVRAVINDAGNVGIGTCTPGSLLHTSGPSNIFKHFTTTNNGTWIEFQANSTNVVRPFYVGQDNSAGGSFGVGGYAGVIFTSSGDPVVLATASTARLTVAGNGIATFACTVCAPIFTTVNGVVAVGAGPSTTDIFTATGPASSNGMYLLLYNQQGSPGGSTGMAFINIWNNAQVDVYNVYCLGLSNVVNSGTTIRLQSLAGNGGFTGVFSAIRLR